MLTQTRIRQLLILLTVVLTLAAVVLVLWGAQLTLGLWREAMQLPWPLQLGFIALLLAIGVAGLWISVRLWRSRPRPRAARRQPPRLNAQQMQQRIRDAAAQGINTQQAEEEWRLATSSGPLTIALFGEVSSGKSSLIRALLPDADTRVDVLAGSTSEIQRHDWQSGEQAITLVDMPGTGHIAEDGPLIDEARRADLVLMVCDNDLTAPEWQALRQLEALDKPLILVLNKIDQFSLEQRDSLQAHLRARLKGHPVELACVAAGKREKRIVVSASGERETRWQHEAGDLSDLLAAIREQLDDSHQLRSRGQQARLALTLDCLERSRLQACHAEGEALVRRYAKRAMVGALAAMAPGSDLIIQGALAYGLLRQLGNLYGVEVRDMDIERFLDRTRGRFRATTSLTLAVAGNALKAFPGMGTLTGGLTHAVAYSLIFDSVGRAANDALSQHGELIFDPDSMERHVSQNLEQRARTLAAVALEQNSQDAKRDQGG